MKEKLKHLKPIQNMMLLALIVLLFILTTQTSALAQLFAPVPQTGQTQIHNFGDDGDLQMGVQWPFPRFFDNSDGTVTDNLTGLIWLKNADCFGGKSWNDALDVSNNLADGQCGLSDGSSSGDWRLSNVRELRSLIDHGQYRPPLPSGYPFTNVLRVDYWSSTTVANRTDGAWLVVLGLGDIGFSFGQVWYDPKGSGYHVWPVRGGNEVVFVAAPIPKTGQTQSYASGDDGYLQMGVQWPDPRFSDNSDGTVTDNLTGLIWLKNADCFGGKSWNDALDVSNNLADGQCGLSDGSSSGAWRLSNVRELLSLIDYDNSSPALASGHPFTNVRSTGGEPSSSYWSSTTVANRTDAACLVVMDPGSALMDDAPKGQSFRGVWPVRGGDAENQQPYAICQDVTLSTEPGLCTADASVDEGSFDPDGGPITLEQTPSAPYGLSDTEVTLTITDDRGATDTCDATVTVVDEEDPVISSVAANPNKLWPPNHKMVPVTVAVDDSDNCDSVCQIVLVESNEPVDGLGDGNTAPDGVITGNLTVKLRAESSGTNSGRIYTITVDCADSSGNSSTDTVKVTVPHDKGK